ncbi:MAG: hypothetical protein U0N90_00280, partial [Blautia sp.]
FDLCHRNFVHFQGRRWRRTGRTPTEDNVENGQNYMAEAFGPLYTEGIHGTMKNGFACNPGCEKEPPQLRQLKTILPYL